MRYLIVGDVHGDLNQLLYPLRSYLRDPLNSKLIYLGDYFDRGDMNAYISEILHLIIEEKKKHNPTFNNIILLRGNHDSYQNGTPDYIGSLISQSADAGKMRVMSPYSSDIVYSRDLPLFYYDDDLKVLFSHSPQSEIPLHQLLKLNVDSPGEPDDKIYDKHSALTTSRDSPRFGKDFKYKNCHGHDHKMSDERDIQEFFTSSNNVTMISLDNDASYGFRLVNNFYYPDWVLDPELARDDESGIGPYDSSVYSMVTFVEFDTDEGEFDIRKWRFDLYSEGDFNMLSFSDLCEEMTKWNSEFRKLTLNNAERMLRTFYEKYVNQNSELISAPDDFVTTIIDIFDLTKEKEIPYYYDDVDKVDDGVAPYKKNTATCYFHDTPWEIYNKMGYEGRFMQPWVIYWNLIQDFKFVIPGTTNYDDRETNGMIMYGYDLDDSFEMPPMSDVKQLMSGGGFSGKSWLIIGIVAVLVVIAVVVVIVVMLNKKNVVYVQMSSPNGKMINVDELN